VPPLTTWLISIYDWRLSCVIIGGLVLTFGILAAQYLKRDPSQIGLAPFGQKEAARLEQSPAADGLTLREAVATRQFWMIAVIFAFLGYCVFAISIHLVPHITDMNITPATAANVLAITGGIQAVSGILMGYLADRIGSLWVLGLSMVLMSAALFGLIPVQEVGLLYLFAAIYGIAVGAGGPMEPIIVADLFGIKSHGFILGAVSLSFTIGGAIGPCVTGYIFDLTHSYRLAFLICALLAVTAIVLVVLLRPRFHSSSMVTSQ
jgi:MFS family permease